MKEAGGGRKGGGKIISAKEAGKLIEDEKGDSEGDMRFMRACDV